MRQNQAHAHAPCAISLKCRQLDLDASVPPGKSVQNNKNVTLIIIKLKQVSKDIWNKVKKAFIKCINQENPQHIKSKATVQMYEERLQLLSLDPEADAAGRTGFMQLIQQKSQVKRRWLSKLRIAPQKVNKS